MSFARALATMLFALLAPPAAAFDLAEAAAAAEDPAELSRTFEQAFVHVPAFALADSAAGPLYGLLGADYVRRRLARQARSRRLPVVVFLHGCNGIGFPELAVEKLAGGLGFAVVFPNSFARSFRPRDCSSRGERWGLFPLVHLYRRAELRWAMRSLRAMPWVDPDRIFVGGFDEGAVAVALWGAQVSARGYVIAGWTCNAPAEMPWLQGLRTPADAPTLTLVSRDDAHYRWRGFAGDCAGTATAGRDVQSLVIAGAGHNVFAYPEAIDALREFLLANGGAGAQP